MSDPKKTASPGLLKDPWRNPQPVTASKPVDTNIPLVSEETSPINQDIQAPSYATIALKNYGGITVAGVLEINHAAAQILKFCVDHIKQVDDILVKYGVVVAQLPLEKLNTPFYIQRADGWLLAVPAAKTRDEGCLQLIQALVTVSQHPKLRAELKTYQIRPYKV